MMADPGGRPTAEWVFGALSLAVLVAVVVAMATSASAFSTYNARWDGASELQSVAASSGAEATVTLDTAAYRMASPDGTVALVLAPDRYYGSNATERVRSFVRAGGHLIVAEDYAPYGNALLAGIGADARVNGTELRDERYHYRGPALPIARNVTANASLVTGVNGITMNHGTVVEPGSATVLVRSSGYAYLDRNGNDELDDIEQAQSYPVVAVQEVGDGRVTVVSDPSVFINTMLDRSGNRQFAANLFAGNDSVLLDYSHAQQQPPLAVLLLFLRRSPLLQAVLGMVGIGAVVGWLRRPDLVRGAVVRGQRTLDRLVGATPADETAVQPDTDRLAAHLADEHPEWDKERVRRVIAGVLSEEPKYWEDDDPR
jgi:hypothetical protein